jgi:hypothetical protein
VRDAIYHPNARPLLVVTERRVELSFAPDADSTECIHHIFLEVVRLTMGRERGIVPILLVDKEPGMISAMAVDDEH